MIKAIYPLLFAKTKEESGLYTMTCYDVYKHGKLKYIRGEVLLYTDDHTDNEHFMSMENIPLTIEESENYKEWKCSYNYLGKPASNIDYIAGAVAYSMLTKK